jgi:hypothetical protein
MPSSANRSRADAAATRPSIVITSARGRVSSTSTTTRRSASTSASGDPAVRTA